MKNLIFLLLFIFPISEIQASCKPVDVLVIGDSQAGATWAQNYFGNFLPTCLKGSFAIYGRGGTVPAHWVNSSKMDHVETVERTNLNHHRNIGPAKALPECQKRIGPMLDTHAPRKVIYQFGGNMIYLSETEATKQINELMGVVESKGIEASQCYFVVPTYEMAVVERRNVPARNLEAVLKINKLIKNAINGRCQVIDGVELMKGSPYFDGKELLKRIQIPGLRGCAGAAGNDNVHVCGAAARDWAQRVCIKIEAEHTYDSPQD